MREGEKGKREKERREGGRRKRKECGQESERESGERGKKGGREEK